MQVSDIYILSLLTACALCGCSTALRCYTADVVGWYTVEITGKFTIAWDCEDHLQCIRFAYKIKNDPYNTYLAALCESNCAKALSGWYDLRHISEIHCDKECKTDYCNQASSNLVMPTSSHVLRCFYGRVPRYAGKFRQSRMCTDPSQQCILLYYKQANYEGWLNKEWMAGYCFSNCADVVKFIEFNAPTSEAITDIRCVKECKTDLCNKGPLNAGVETSTNELRCYMGLIFRNYKFRTFKLCYPGQQCILLSYKGRFVPSDRDISELMWADCFSNCTEAVDLYARNPYHTAHDVRCEKECKTDLCNQV